MMTREEVIRRLEEIARVIIELKGALEEGWNDVSAKDQTQAFLEKCGGWEDTRSPEEIIADIYAARTTSNRGATIFNKDLS
ncbi:MAG: hypothetical protein HY731_07395 [Candidatus Tectomicrobia bacterium]|nr:hypothetical protein [Candidatus Tectomicrobia bacterium]